MRELSHDRPIGHISRKRPRTPGSPAYVARMKRLISSLLGLGVVLGLVVAPGTASAAEPVPPLGWGIQASVGWIEHDPGNLVRMQGNTYTVDLTTEQNPLGRYVRGVIGEYRCKPGEIIGGIDPGPGQCAYLGSLTLDGAASTTMTFDRHTGSATLRGQMLATHDDGSSAGSIYVALSWTGQTLLSQKSYRFGFSPADGVQYSILGWRRNWTAAASGHIGRLGTGDAGNEPVSAATARYSLKSVQLVG